MPRGRGGPALRGWWTAHAHVRLSTLVLTAVFLATLVVYFVVRPASQGHASPARPQPSPTSTSSSVIGSVPN